MEKPPSETPIYDRVRQDEQTQQNTQQQRQQSTAQRYQALGALGLIGQLGVSTAVSVVLPLLVGIWLDNTLGLMPLFTLLLTFLGLAVALRNLLVLTERANPTKKPTKPSTPPSQPERFDN